MDSLSILIYKAKEKANKHNINRQLINTSPINNIEQYSILLNSYYVASYIRDYIYTKMTHNMNQQFVIYKKDITVNIYSIKSIPKAYMKQILSILYLLVPYSPLKYSKELSIQIYLTPFKKLFPKQGTILGPEHINSGVSSSSRTNSEVIIFREEEWFKVYIHELFHNLGLDFSQYSVSYFKKELNKLHTIQSEFLLYEAYSECWATIIQLIYFNRSYTREINHALCQAKRIILFAKDYRENTNVFCYYFIKAVFLSDIDYYIEWCKKNNHNLFYYKYTQKNNEAFMSLYKTLLPDFMDDLRNIVCNKTKSLRMTYKN